MLNRMKKEVLFKAHERTLQVVFLIAFTFIFSMLFFSTCLSEKYQFTYKRTEEDSDGNSATYYYDISFDYNDIMMVSNANTMSSKLSKASVGLATAAYEKDSIVNLVRRMGYTKLNAINFSDSALSLDDADYVGYLLSEKETVINGEDYVIYLVPVRGTISSNAEWFSDFNLGTGTNHAGFYNAAAEVQRNLEGRISANADRYDADHTIVWLMGHSRGAAISNIVAGRLTEKANAGKIKLKSSHIHSYNYACPAVSKNADVSMSNVHNFINDLDLIPMLPAQDWGYRRYGQNHDMIDNPANDEDFAYHFKYSHAEEYAEYDKQLIYDILINLLQSPENLDSPAIHAMVDLTVLWFVAPDSGITMEEILAKHFVSRSFLESLIDWTVDHLALLSPIGRAMYFGEAVGSFIAEAGSTLSKEDIKDLNDLADKFNELMDRLSPAKTGIFDAHTPETYVGWVAREGYGYNPQNDIIKGDYILPNYVTTICPGMFTGNQEITSITIHGNITNPENLCFSGCSNLRRVSLQEVTMKEFPVSMFANCSMLEYVDLPGGLERIGATAFVNCTQLKSISFPETVTCIENVNFWGCDNLESVSMPGLVEMGYSCFSNCPKLNNISLPSSLTSVGDSCFSNCTALTSITIPASLQNWGNAVFSNCSSLRTVSLSNDLTTIGVAAFYNCDALETIVIPDSVQTIGQSVCSGCDSLRSVTLPVDIITPSLFSGSPVEHAVFTKGKTGISPDGGVCGISRTVRSVIFKEGITRIGSTCMPGADETALEEVQFPSTLQEIGENAFVNQNRLTVIKFPAGIRTIGNACFADCTALNKVIFLSEVPAAIQEGMAENGNIFYNAIPTIYIPHGTTVSENITLMKCHYCPENLEGYADFTFSISDEQKSTCMEEGVGSYPYCSHCGMIFADTTLTAQATMDQFILPVDPKNHIWDEAVYEWNDDNTVLTAHHVCLLNEDHFEEESVGAVRTATESPASETEGTYSAISRAFKNPAFEPQETEGIIPATGTLSTFTLPAQLNVVEEEAFAGNTIEAVIIPTSCTRIEVRAFADCPNLIYVQIPETIELAEDAFEDSLKVIIDWNKNSTDN